MRYQTVFYYIVNECATRRHEEEWGIGDKAPGDWSYTEVWKSQSSLVEETVFEGHYDDSIPEMAACLWRLLM